MNQKKLIFKVFVITAAVIFSWAFDGYIADQLYYGSIYDYYSWAEKANGSNIEYEIDSKTCNENRHKDIFFQELNYHIVRKDCFLEKIKERSN